jgi:hypothetical protein
LQRKVRDKTPARKGALIGNTDKFRTDCIPLETRIITFAVEVSTVPGIRLFEIEEFGEFTERAAENALAQEILREISVRSLVKKKPSRSTVYQNDKECQAREFNFGRVRKILPIRIYARLGVIWYKYPYPFCKSGFIERSTKVRLKQGSTQMMKGTTLVHPALSRFVELLQFERDEVLFSQSQAYPELSFLSVVEHPRDLVKKLSTLEPENAQRLYKDTKAAIADRREPKIIEQMKSRLLAYAPKQYEALINELRIREGKSPIVNDLSKLRRLEKQDARAARANKNKKQ